MVVFIRRREQRGKSLALRNAHLDGIEARLRRLAVLFWTRDRTYFYKSLVQTIYLLDRFWVTERKYVRSKSHNIAMLSM